MTNGLPKVFIWVSQGRSCGSIHMCLCQNLHRNVNILIFVNKIGMYKSGPVSTEYFSVFQLFAKEELVHLLPCSDRHLDAKHSKFQAANAAMFTENVYRRWWTFSGNHLDGIGLVNLIVWKVFGKVCCGLIHVSGAYKWAQLWLKIPFLEQIGRTLSVSGECWALNSLCIVW